MNFIEYFRELLLDLCNIYLMTVMHITKNVFMFLDSRNYVALVANVTVLCMFQ
jgi:hypothetical protein